MARKREKTPDLFADLAEEPEKPERAAKPASPAVPDMPPPIARLAAGTPVDLGGKKVFVIDSHSLIYQVFHAISSMTAPDGRPVNALYGFLRDLLDLLARHKPDLLACAFDHSEITFRNDLYPEYKAHRDPMPEDLRSQIPHIQRLLDALGIPVIELPGYEADDIMATLARRVAEAGGRCVLVTADKDCRQLINDSVSLLNIRKGQLYGAPELLADWGVRPDQVVDFQALVGDSVDNVPGVESIGPKTATQLLQEYGTLDEVLANATTIKGKKGEKLAECADLARISKQLVKLDDDAPLEFDWSRAVVGQWDVETAVAICTEFGFRSLTDRVTKLGPATVGVTTWEANYRTVDTLEELRAEVERARRAGRFSFDTETTSTNPNWADLVGISLCSSPGEAIYVPVRAPAGARTLAEADVVAALQPLLGDPGLELVGQNIKYDLIVMRRNGLVGVNRLFDTLVADLLSDPGRPTHNLDELASRHLGHQTIPITDLIGTGREQGRMDEVPVPRITDYAAEDADVPMRLFPLLTRAVENVGLTELFRDVEMPLVQVLADMEYHGIRVDPDSLAALSKEFGVRLKLLEREIWQAAGSEFNVDSPKQLAEVLFDKLGLQEQRKTKTGRSTDNEVLEELEDRHPVPKLVIEYRQLGKLKGTYADALAEQINPRTGRVHTSFMQDVARTGRLSSKDPNLQNIPVRTAEGRRIRQAFVAGGPGYQLLCADWSQIELRMLAHFCGDAVMTEAFRREEDIHRVVAAEVNGVPLEDVTEAMRQGAKAVNFGIIYGQSPWGLARQLGIPRDAASGFIDAYFARYPAVDGFVRETLTAAAKDGFVRTILGRRRPVEGVRAPGPGPLSRNRTQAERIAVNTVIQGSAADLIKLAMIRVWRRLQTAGLDARLLLQIHDELLFEVADRDVMALAGLVNEEMTSTGALRVPLQVAIEAGPNWNDTQGVSLSSPLAASGSGGP